MLARTTVVSLLGVMLSLAAAACSGRTVPDDGADSDAAAMVGVQPEDPGSMYSACTRSAECAPMEFCVFPSGEAGFCTSACSAPTDPSNCAPPPGDQEATCFDIGLDDGRQVCALECSGIACPRGMRCEQVASGDGERAICF